MFLPRTVTEKASAAVYPPPYHGPYVRSCVKAEDINMTYKATDFEELTDANTMGTTKTVLFVRAAT